MTRLFLVRHGPTHQKSLTGHRDVPADLGDVAAIGRLDAALPRPALLVSSDLQRARSTADMLARGRTRLPDREGLREFDFGRWDGLAHDEIPDDETALARAYWEEPGDIAPPDGESWNAAAARIGAEIDALVRDNAGRDIVVVAHMGVILTQVARARRCTPYTALGQPVAPLSLTELHRREDGWHDVRTNHVP